MNAFKIDFAGKVTKNWAKCKIIPPFFAVYANRPSVFTFLSFLGINHSNEFDNFK